MSKHFGVGALFVAPEMRGLRPDDAELAQEDDS